MPDELNSVNAEQENVVDSQIDTQEETTEQDSVETVNAEPAEVAAPKQKEKPVQTQDENAKIAAARRAAEMKARDDLIAEMYGESHNIRTYADYQKALEAQRQKEQEENLTSKGLPEDVAKEIIESRKFREQVKEREYEAQIEKQKAVLKDKPFFVDLEPDIDALIKETRAKGQQVDVEVVYKYLRGEKMDELLAKAQKDAEKRTVANIHDRAKRGIPAGTDGGNADDVDMSDINLDMARAFGNDPKEIAKYVKKQTRR